MRHEEEYNGRILDRALVSTFSSFMARSMGEKEPDGGSVVPLKSIAAVIMVPSPGRRHMTA